MSYDQQQRPRRLANCLPSLRMAQSSDEKTRLVDLDERSLEETARSKLEDPNYLTSFDDGTARKVMGINEGSF